jgi:hypothetical protein
MVNAQELHKDLIQPKEKQPKLLKYFQQNIENTTHYIYTLGAILRGEYLN